MKCSKIEPFFGSESQIVNTKHQNPLATLAFNIH